MFDIVCVTNRRYCEEPFLDRIKKIAQMRPGAIILREKDLSEAEYRSLARDVIAVCQDYETVCILHSFVDVALELGAKAIHLPLPVLRGMSAGQKSRFSILGASCHSSEDLLEAQEAGCTYITAGHIFETDCKAGLPGRGLGFLSGICNLARIPVYAIGGIAPSNITAVRDAGASGACIMGGFMRCPDVPGFCDEFRVRLSGELM